ncbi:putative leucine-rich repeat-containing protein DDB_G0290503 isoform X15 [Drosophila suzukii]|uniref:Leucine-rich repeat-containing protein DDB_G0290503 isoform X15 n=1 Tax=Drosophila suzukii TaxID=28584 RepID=A0AB39ZWW3_DROSZ
MDPASSIVEKVVETKNGTQEVDAGVIEMATKNIDNSVESPLESNIGSNVGQSITSTDDNDDADLVIEESESDEHSSDGERTSDVAETEDLIKVAEIDKPSLSSDANSTAEINGSAEIESEDPTVEDSSIKSDPETSVLDSTKADKRSTVSEENPNVEVIDENIVIVSTSDARMANVPQETSKIIIEGDEVKRTEEVALKDCTESLTEKGAKEPTTCELTAENTKNEVFSPIENVNELKELGKNAVENKDVKLFQETQQGREANEITDQSELLNDNIRDREHLRLSNQTDFNNQILDIISDIDINIKAQEKITQLKEQELKLIQKQNELANQIHQQQILAQQLNAKNTIKQSQFQSDKFDSKCQQQNDRDVSTLTLNQNNVISKEHTDIPKTIDLRKIFTPATDATEILPKNRKLYASSAFYSPTLHPTVEDQVELARRISHSLSDISNQTSKGQSMYVNRKKRSDKWVHEGRSQDYQQYQQKPAISPNILPAYSDAGKHRVQLNIHQNQLIEKYSKPGLQVVQSPWDAALQTGSASTAFLEDKDTKSQCFSPAAVSPTPYFQSGRRDFTDAVEPTHYSPQKDYNNAIASPPQSTNVPSNPQRELAYTPSVAQGWGGRNVELPKGLYVPKEISLSSYAAPPQQYAGNNEHFESPNNGSVSRPLPRTNFSAFQSTVGNNGTGQFPLSKPLSPGFSTVPPKQQLYSPSSYQRIPIGSENVAPQVSFNPAPLTFDKLARYEQPDRKNSTSTSSQYLNVQQNSQVRNASPTPFGIVLNEHTSGSPSSAGSIGSPYRQLLPTGSPRGGPSIGRPTSPLANKGQIFNQCARGWGAIPDKQQTYQSQFSSPTTGNLPYTDF